MAHARRIGSVVLIALVGSFQGLIAQVSTEPAQIVNRAVALMRSPDGASAAGGVVLLRQLFEERGADLTPQVIAATADTLLRIAGTAPPPGTPASPGQIAAFTLLRRLRVGSPPRPIVTPVRMGQELARLSDGPTRAGFIEYIGFHSDTTAAVEELQGIARSANDGIVAVEQLERLGAVGRTALIQLYQQGNAASPEVRARLRQLSRRGFPVDTIGGISWQRKRRHSPRPARRPRATREITAGTAATRWVTRLS